MFLEISGIPHESPPQGRGFLFVIWYFENIGGEFGSVEDFPQRMELEVKSHLRLLRNLRTKKEVRENEFFRKIFG